MLCSNSQVKRLMTEFNKCGEIDEAALRANMHPKTARKYLAIGKLPSELKKPRDWRTRKDPFEEDWPKIHEMLTAAPELEAVTIFEYLCSCTPGRYAPGQLRTLQRRIKRWRAEEGPPKELFFPQVHRPGEAMQTDFTSANELRITIAGQDFPHLLCHPVLPYSNWEWVTVCRSESFQALKRGVQEALFRLGRVPAFHQTDHSSAATHDLRTGGRDFNREYLEFVAHFGMTPRTIAVGKKEQNGDAEALHRAFKRRVDQHLLLRGSRDFSEVVEYERWLQDIARGANAGRLEKLQEELSAMRALAATRLPEFSEVEARVSSGGIIWVKSNAYSVPPRLRGERVRARVYDDRVEVYYAQKLQLQVERLRGKGKYRVNYRHVIHSLVRKPGAFARYRYRDALFPTETFRRAYERLSERLPERRADIEYLRCLELAADTVESEVERAIQEVLDAGGVPTAERIASSVKSETPTVPEISIPAVELAHYDALLPSGLKEATR